MIDKEKILRVMKDLYPHHPIFKLISVGEFDIKEKPLYSKEFTDVNIELDKIKSDIKEIEQFQSDCYRSIIDNSEKIEELKIKVESNKNDIAINFKEIEKIKNNHMALTGKLFTTDCKLSDEIVELKKIIYDQDIKICELQTVIGKIGEAINVE